MTMKPESAVPTATTFPSGWTATSLMEKFGPMSSVRIPSPENLVSSFPVGVQRANVLPLP